MTDKVIVYKARTNTIQVDMGYDVSSETFTSEIRAHPDLSGLLLATWTVTYTTDGTDGWLTLTLDDAVTINITADEGYMDIKRVSSGEPLPVFDNPIPVEFRGSVTQ